MKILQILSTPSLSHPYNNNKECGDEWSILVGSESAGDGGGRDKNAAGEEQKNE